MNKKHYVPAIILLLTFIVVPGFATVNAEESESSTSPTPSVRPSPTGSPLGGARDRLRAEIETKNQNAKLNQTNRNQLLEQKKNASTTRPVIKTLRGDIRASTTAERREIREDGREDRDEARREGREDMRNASSSDDRREARRDMRADLFKIRKDILVRQLNLSLSNLTQVRVRIVSRIEKTEQSGRNMTEARKALAAADLKITAAQAAVAALVNAPVVVVPPVVASTTASTTAPVIASSTANVVNIERPRQLGNDAIKAVKDAREALNLVVRAIAKNMGLGNGKPTTSPSVTPSVTPSVSPSVTPSVTPTTTPTPSVTATPSPTVSATPSPTATP